MVFSSNYAVREFVGTLIKNLEEINENELKEELIAWSNCAFTTSSEFLGELKLILEKTKNLTALDSKVKNDVVNCLLTIDKAFNIS